MIGRLALAAAAVAALGWPAAAAADTTTIAIPGKYFAPPRPTLVAGDTVIWRNHDLASHDVRVPSGPFDSGPLGRFGSWSQRIDRPGAYPFLCTLHPFMTGSLSVVAATLAAAPDGVLAGEPLTLSGRAPAGTARVGLEQSVAGGPWTGVGDGAAPAADGTFATTVPAVEGASYRVTTPAGAGQVVTPRVTARIDVHLQVVRARRHTVVHVHTTPAATGFTATLQLYSRWHFRWRARKHATLQANGDAMFRLPARRRAYARVVLRRAPRGPALVTSGVVKLWSGKPARDPDAIAPRPGEGGHGGHQP